MKKYFLVFVLLSTMFSCEEDVKIDFFEENIESSKDADVSINFPKAKGNKTVSELINNTIQNYIISQTNLSEDSLTNLSIEDAVTRFNTEFKNFKTDFPESSQKWEAFIDGEVTYRSPQVISIAINSYLDTGGAHGNTNIRFFNFNPNTGELYTKNDLISNIEGLSNTIENQLKENIKSDSEEPIEDFFFGKDFQLPESLGYSDEGLIILYNPYEIASYSQGIIEFTISYNDINSFLNIN
ncbi:DUF3298 and DUF4163 domain-containing protein [Psychroserpens ponticola]|uniref:DUF4163 domain-containing protein n=1 Tax=Psychroserpens ponticola TaxID=2932268 RepID=A0ABY7RWW6_9FLAO|nr:DUF3298 and DUF4163 domain-containing protein [Psychroserpens ponticola]WCO01503.1 DUF4163 domain-containing protein [Psychroserpens ponticola]